MNLYLIRFSISLVAGLIWAIAGLFYNSVCGKDLLTDGEKEEKLKFFPHIALLFAAGTVITFVSGLISLSFFPVLFMLPSVAMLTTVISEIRNGSISLFGIIITGLSALVYWAFLFFSGNSDGLVQRLISAGIMAAIVLISEFFCRKIARSGSLGWLRGGLIISYAAFAPALQSVVMVLLALVAVLLWCTVKKFYHKGTSRGYKSVFDVPYRFSPVLFGTYLFLAMIGWL